MNTPRTDAVQFWDRSDYHDPSAFDWFVRAEHARTLERELASIRSLANRRNKQDHSQDTTHQLVASLDQALDIAQAELAAERARLEFLMRGGVVLSGYYLCRLHYKIDRAAIDAAMQEDNT